MKMLHKSEYLAHLKNFIWHKRKQWLPLCVILAFLLGIWFYWQEEQAGQVLTVKPEKNISEENELPATEGNMVCSVQGALRPRPLPDLFTTNVPKKEMYPQLVNPVAVDAQKQKSAPTVAPSPKQAPKEEVIIPRVCGSVHQGEKHLAILQVDKMTKACAPGDVFDGWKIVYTNAKAVGLEREGQVLELLFE